jgi:outer membrane protein OmpA-like peptidoglycan-associated protein
MRFTLVLWLWIGVIVGGLQGQTTYDQAPSKLQKWYDEAFKAAGVGDYGTALRWLEKSLLKDPSFVDAHLLMGAIYYDQRRLEEAEMAFEKGLDLAPDHDVIGWYQLAFTEWRLEKFREATIHFEQFLSYNPKNERDVAKAREYLEETRFAASMYEDPVPFQPVRLSNAVNSENDEYLPSLTADGKQLVFTRVVRGQEDFYQCNWENGDWAPAEPLEDVNTLRNEGAQCISADGRTLIFTACSRPDGEGWCDLYISHYRNGTWTPEKNMGPGINTRDWESQPTLSGDGRTLYFASDRPGGKGGKDIWASTLGVNGVWSKPFNLGDSINTAKDEKGPFIHADGQTLYFMSNGHKNLGGADLFVARKNADGQWGRPKNLGYPINTKDSEGLLIVSLDGSTAYFATNRKDLTQDPPGRPSDYDLFTFELYPEVRPKPVTYVEAKVKDKRTGRPLQATVVVSDLNTGQVLSTRTTDWQGRFLTVLPLGSDYGLTIDQEGYLFYSDQFSLTKVNSMTDPFELEVALSPVPEDQDLIAAIDRGEAIVLKNVLFEFGSAQLKSVSRLELDRLAKLLEENQQLRIQVQGHTDNIGSPKENQRLSEARAQAVFDYLVAAGIPAVRLNYKGFGETDPIAPNETEEGRKQNRRTEFIIVQ